MRWRSPRLPKVTIGCRMSHLDDLLASMKQLHPLLIDLSLERVERMLAELGSPHKKLPPVVHIAGTNGKGSTTAFLKAMLEAAGKRVHVYTSPHLVRFNERIALAGPNGARPIDEDALAALLQRVADVNAGQSITFFEITTAAAFLAFSETPADFLLLEVGLGGRLDTTNVVDKPALTVITPISMDHADKLGDTVEKIAAEKAGILKRGVPCVVARQTPEVDDVLEAEARKRGATLIRWGEHFEAFNQRGRLVFQREDRLLDLPLPSLIGPHQIVNGGTSVAAALELGIDELAIAAGLTSVRWPARMQRLAPGQLTRELRPDIEVWLDGGHNPGAGEVIARTLADLEERSPRPLVLIVGMVGQKDATGFLQPFAGLARYVITVPVPGAHQPPHLPEALAGAAHEVGLDATTAKDIAAALAVAQSVDDGPLRILICGSLYLAGHVLALQEGQETQSN
jgi:dihydrofolate synthase/folylpolyglutamate synthase